VPRPGDGPVAAGRVPRTRTVRAGLAAGHPAVGPVAATVSGLGHLARRFFGSLRPGGPPADDETWARSHLRPGEVELWARMSGADRRHAVGVARGVPESVVPAALLHDVGKVSSGLGTYGRVVATVAGAVAGREMAAAWSESR